MTWYYIDERGHLRCYGHGELYYLAGYSTEGEEIISYEPALSQNKETSL
jgi:hypothetical protein